MEIIKSPYVIQFNKVAGEILEGSAEAISNLHYLNILVQPCQKLHESTVKEIPEQIQNLLWLIRVIWLNSPYYNTVFKFYTLKSILITKLIGYNV